MLLGLRVDSPSLGIERKVGLKEDQAYINQIIGHLHLKQCEAEYKRLLDLWEQTDLGTNLELAEFYFSQMKEMYKRIQELYQQSRRGGLLG